MAKPAKVFVRTPFNYDREAVSNETGLVCEAETLAKQEFKEECDINTILKRFNITGELPQGVRMPTFGDFVPVGTFHEAANAIAVAREAFDELPAEVRRRFANDPGEFVAFCSDPKNLEEARGLGLVPPLELKPDVPASTAGSGAGGAGAEAPQPAAPVVAPVVSTGAKVG